jgi:hypothetical protein
MGEKSDAKLMFSIDGKEFREISEIPDLATVAEEANCENIEWFRHPQEMTFSCSVHPLMLYRLFMDELTFVRYCQSKQSNNWLKRHGLPMCRKLR